MSRTVEIEITAKVTATIEVPDNETDQDIKDRTVDIFLHDAGDEGSFNKTDLGSDDWKIKILR
jgi:hypothetical protein